MKLSQKIIVFLTISCMGIMMLNLLNTKATITEKEGLQIGTVVYDYDENGNLIERVIDEKGAVTIEEAEKEYYERFVGSGDLDENEGINYNLITIDEYGKEEVVESFQLYEDALKAYDVSIVKNSSLNYAIKSQDIYWKIKYAVVKFKKISKDGTILNTYYTEADTNIKGYTNASYALDGAYLESDDSKVKFRMAGVTGIVDAPYVEIVPYADKITYISYYSVSNGKLYHKLRSNDFFENGSYSSTINVGDAPDYLKSSTVYYSYDGHYFYTDYFKMIDDYRTSTSKNAVNPDQPYYNYYQFLPLHSQTNYTAEELDSFIKSRYSEKPTSKDPIDLKNTQSLLVDEGASFMQGHDFGVNPLMTMGIAINESAWGRSKIAITKNNLFGLNAVDANPSGNASEYISVASCIEIFTKQWVTWGYLDTNDSRYYGGHLGDKASGMNIQYASDPYWGEKAASHCYSIDDYLGKKDVQKYALGIKEDPDYVNIRKKATTGSEIIYALKNPNSNVRNMPVIILENANGSSVNGNKIWYKILTDHPLDENQKKIARYNNEELSWIYEQKYDFNNSYGYVSSEYIRKINDAQNNDKPIDTFDIDIFLNKASLSVKDGYLYGISTQTNIDTYISKLQSIDNSIQIDIDTNAHTNDQHYITTDMKLTITSLSGKTYSYLTVIKADVNCDGKISSVDYVLIKNHILKIKALSGAASLAADVNTDTKISSVDYVLIKNHILGLSQIK